MEELYERFLAALTLDRDIREAAWRVYAGQRFLYVASPLQEPALSCKLIKTGREQARGTAAQVECAYVRSEPGLHVYRFRFTIPNQKRFCCGNLCPDCIRLRKD